MLFHPSGYSRSRSLLKYPFVQTPIRDTKRSLNFYGVIIHGKCTNSAASKSVTNSNKIHTGNIVPSANICSLIRTNSITLYSIHVIDQCTVPTVPTILLTGQYSVSLWNVLLRRFWALPSLWASGSHPQFRFSVHVDSFVSSRNSTTGTIDMPSLSSEVLCLCSFPYSASRTRSSDDNTPECNKPLSVLCGGNT